MICPDCPVCDSSLYFIDDDLRFICEVCVEDKNTPYFFSASEALYDCGMFILQIKNSKDFIRNRLNCLEIFFRNNKYEVEGFFEFERISMTKQDILSAIDNYFKIKKLQVFI
jgi:septum formation topological specificity factor MinE